MFTLNNNCCIGCCTVQCTCNYFLLGRKILDDLSSSAETTLSKGGDPLSSAAAATLQAQAQQVHVHVQYIVK